MAANNIPHAVLAQLIAINNDNNWAIEIREDGPNKHPNPTLIGAPPPTPPITPMRVVVQLQKIYAQSRWYLRHIGHLGFLHPVTREFIPTNYVQYRQIIFFITYVLDHLRTHHLPHGNSFARAARNIPYRRLFYLWEKKFQHGYAPGTGQRVFRRIFALFLKIVNLPMCALRIVGISKGEFCMPAMIVRDGEDQDCMNFHRLISEEWACRLYHVAVPEYSANLAIIPFEDPVTNTPYQVQHSLLIEKKCVMNTFFINNFHMENNCVVFTGSGYPDTNSKAFAKFIELYYDRQVQGLCDNNPCGVNLLKTYHHTRDEAACNKMLKTDVGWFGLNPAFGLAFPQVHQTLGYSQTDRDILTHLLNENNEFVLGNGPNMPKYANPARATFRRNQLNTMLQDERKCDLDTLPTQPLLDAIKFLLDQGQPVYEGVF